MADTNGDDSASIVDLVEAQAAQSPLAIALEGNGERLTYERLHARANHVATRLQQLGVGPDVPVALCAPRSTDTMVALLGILKAGGAYLPLDPAYPRDRLAFMLADAHPALVLAHSETAALLPEYAPLLCLDRDSDNLRGERADLPPRVLGPDNLAYVIYTSGSTGQPKGVAMVHRALVNLVRWQCDSSGGWGRERTLQLTPLSFDVSFQEIFSTWAAGGTLVLTDEEVRRDPQRLLQLLASCEVRRLFLPFVALQQLAEVALRQGPMPYSLREVITAGEALRITRHLVDLFQRLPGCTLHNQYGPTETHVVTAYRLQGPPNHWSALPPIGHALPGVSLLIRDEAGAASSEGELYVAGQALARGYLGHPELTTARFVIDNVTGLRCYRTGDWVRLRDDGELDFVGRNDDQVKLNGFRIELGEVEAALNAQPGVAQAAVALREDEPGERRLVGYVVFESGASPSTTDMRRALQTGLPEHMVPAIVVSLSALPRTPSGKVDRRALPRPEGSRPELDVAYEAPRTATETEIARVWQHLLDLDRVGIHDSFFDLGGTSLSAVRGALDLRGILGRDISPVEILRHPTVFELARFLDGQGEPAAGPAQPAVQVEAK
jgi:amino acid adenylation domain-containing protein